ncbi:MAG: hypothetical protein HQL13_07025 [Candidatus Omnitrophica bacterium]|nr:hypothetical protein [Candidatus Omnitrophota bacterium]
MIRQLMILGLLFVLFIPQGWANSSQYPNPYRQTMWNNVTDSIHTLGQTPQQAKITKKKLHNQRAQKRMDSTNKAIRAQNIARIKAWQAAQNP